MCKKNISRRRFLGQASCAAIGATSFMSSFLNMGLMNAAAAANLPTYGNNNYRALVCILLAGGNDSFNMLIPRNGSNYTDYATTRSNLAIDQNTLLPLNYTDSNGKQFGTHPSMPEVQQLFNTGKLSFISNVGTLLQPTTKTQYYNESVPLPLGLFSHADQIQQWQTSIPQTRSAIGWGGRLADILQSTNNNQNISMNVSLSGTNFFQSGNQVTEYSITPEGSVGIEGYNGPNFYDDLRTSAVNSLLEQSYQGIFQKTYNDKLKSARDAHNEFSVATESIVLNTPFSASGLSQSLQMVAKTIAARNTLNMCRQTFFITFGGWDHHDEVLNNQTNMLGVVSQALNEFNNAMEELNVENDVTTFTISDFARTLTSNGNGTDHAWGGNTMVMGGSVNGGSIYGTYPELYLNNPLDVYNGVLIPTTSCDEYFAELALWFGASTSDLNQILPNIGNFYNVGSGNSPIGFMS